MRLEAEANSHKSGIKTDLGCIVDITIINASIELLHIVWVDELHRSLVSMLPACTNEKVGFRIPTDPFFRRYLVKHHYNMDHRPEACQYLAQSLHCHLDILVNLSYRWFSGGWDDRRNN